MCDLNLRVRGEVASKNNRCRCCGCPLQPPIGNGALYLQQSLDVVSQGTPPIYSLKYCHAFFHIFVSSPTCELYASVASIGTLNNRRSIGQDFEDLKSSPHAWVMGLPFGPRKPGGVLENALEWYAISVREDIPPEWRFFLKKVEKTDTASVQWTTFVARVLEKELQRENDACVDLTVSDCESDENRRMCSIKGERGPAGAPHSPAFALVAHVPATSALSLGAHVLCTASPSEADVEVETEVEAGAGARHAAPTASPGGTGKRGTSQGKGGGGGKSVSSVGGGGGQQ